MKAFTLELEVICGGLVMTSAAATTQQQQTATNYKQTTTTTNSNQTTNKQQPCNRHTSLHSPCAASPVVPRWRGYPCFRLHHPERQSPHHHHGQLFPLIVTIIPCTCLPKQPRKPLLPWITKFPKMQSFPSNPTP